METIRGTKHADELFADSVLDTRIDGRGGDDLLWGQAGNDQLYGGDGNDALYGQGGNDYLDGGAGRDSVFDEGGVNVLRGRAGDDVMFASSPDPATINLIYGDRGDDWLGTNGAGYTHMEGGVGNDRFQIICMAVVDQAIEMVLGRGNNTVSFDDNDNVNFSQVHVRDFSPGEDHLIVQADDVANGGQYVPPAAMFAQMDTDGNKLLDGNDAGTAFAHAFKLGGIEHGIGMIIQGDALVIELPPGVEALAQSDFLL